MEKLIIVKINKFLLVLMTFVLIFSLFGCEHNDSSKGSKGSNIKNTPETSRNSNLASALSDSENRLGIFIEGKADIYIYDSNGNQVSSIVNCDSYSDFDEDLFSYTFINKEKSNLYIPSIGYRTEIKFGSFTDADILIKILDNESKTIAAADFSDIPISFWRQTITLDAVEEITKNNIDSLELLCGNKPILPTDVKTDYAQMFTLDRNKSISKGETEQITYSVTPSETKINWKSSDESIATVDSKGMVSAVNYGYAVISASTSDGNITENCYVCVPCNATSITFIEDYEFVVGAKYEIKPEFTPSYATNTELKFTSSDSSIISVNNDDGILKAESAGMATITAETDNGKKASCVINVVDELDRTVSGITLTPSGETISANEEIEFTATIENDKAILRNLSWSIENSSVAIIERIDDNKCTIKAVGSGKTKLVVTADDGSCSSQATIVVK